jgi:hypothetical protein
MKRKPLLMTASCRRYRQVTDERKVVSIVARFHRTFPAPKSRAKKDYSVFRPHVRKDFEECCAYCLRHEDWADGEDTFEIDHHRPLGICGEDGICDFYNLYWSCHRCNHRKLDNWPSEELLAKGICFVDFCKDDFDKHFQAMPNGRWEPLTESARYTERILRLNSHFHVQRRLVVMKLGCAMDKPNPDKPQ